MSEKKVYRLDLVVDWGSSRRWMRGCSLMEAFNRAFEENGSSSIKKMELTPKKTGLTPHEKSHSD